MIGLLPAGSALYRRRLPLPDESGEVKYFRLLPRHQFGKLFDKLLNTYKI